MIKNYFKIAFRNILRHKAYSVLNISGLAIGMACSILILLWVQDELSYDRFNANANQLYRLTCNAGDFKAAVTPPGMAEGLQNEIPGIKATVRLSKPTTILLETGDRKFEEKHGFYADSNFLQVFSYKLKAGDSKTAMQRPDAILITEDLAIKYFGDKNAVGKIIKKDNHQNCLVTGILEKVPSNSHLQFDYILPMSSIANIDYDLKHKSWGNFVFYTYLQLSNNITPAAASFARIVPQIQKLFKIHNPDLKADFHLQPLTDIHLYSDLQIDLPGKGNAQYVKIFFIVAIIIMVVACINFMNLATARSSRRAKEVGLRKVVGAGKMQLIFQFLGESIIISFISLLVAVGIASLLIPAFNQLADKKLAISLLEPKMFFNLVVIAFITGIISGSYPALFLSGFKPIQVLKGKMRPGSGNLILRNSLVVTQFVVTIILLVGTAVVYQQLNFIKNKNLGFEKSNLLYIPMSGDIWNKQEPLKIALQQDRLTNDFSIISDLPTALVTGTVDADWPGKDPKLQVVIPSMDVDGNFIKTFKIQVLSGRGFSNAFKGDSSNYVLNEVAVKLMGMTVENAIGKPISFSGTKGNIIGVVKNFNFKSLQYSIDPLVLRLNKYGGIVMVRTKPQKTEATIASLARIYQKLNPSTPFSYNFLDQDLDNLYRGEKRMGSLFNLFAILAIFISCLGLYGLSAFMTEQRTKEIGVRKVLGASVFRIVHLLSGSFTKLILIAVAIAVPLSLIAINSWLSGFAFHINVSWLIFVLAAVASMLIAWGTISYESIKAANANPVKSLRSE